MALRSALSRSKASPIPSAVSTSLSLRSLRAVKRGSFRVPSRSDRPCSSSLRSSPVRPWQNSARLASAAGSTTILNPAPATDLRGQDLSSVDLLTPNETEARILVGRDPDDPIDLDTLAAELLALGVRTVVITLGEAGARLVEQVPNGDLVATSVPAWPVEVVDSNGAGDSFNAGLAVGLAEGRSLVEAATFAGAVAGLCCQEWETVPSYQDRATVDRFMTENREGALA